MVGELEVETDGVTLGLGDDEGEAGGISISQMNQEGIVDCTSLTPGVTVEKLSKLQ